LKILNGALKLEGGRSMDLTTLAGLLKSFGPTILILLALIYIILKSEITLKFPRQGGKK